MITEMLMIRLTGVPLRASRRRARSAVAPAAWLRKRPMRIHQRPAMLPDRTTSTPIPMRPKARIRPVRGAGEGALLLPEPGPQDTAAVQGKGRHQVEDSQGQVDEGQVEEEGGEAGHFRHRQEKEEGEAGGGDGEGRQGARDRDLDLVHGAVRLAPQVGDHDADAESAEQCTLMTNGKSRESPVSASWPPVLI